MEILTKHIKDFVSLKSGKNVMLVRHGESMGNYAGTLIGWTDSKLTIKGMAKRTLRILDLFISINSPDKKVCISL